MPKDYSKRNQRFNPYNNMARVKYAKDINNDSEGLLMNDNQSPWRLFHAIFVGGRYHDENHHVEDEEAYRIACGDIVEQIGKFTKSRVEAVHIEDCDNLFKFRGEPILHYHALMMVRCDRNTKQPIMSKEWRNRHFFRHMGNADFGCEDCVKHGQRGKGTRCNICNTFCVFRPIKNKEHALATKQYIERRHAEHNGEDDFTFAVKHCALRYV